MKKIGFYIVIISCLLLVFCIRNNKLLKMDANTNMYYLPNSEFRFGKISNQDSDSTIRQLIGNPERIEQDKYLELETWYYKNLAIEVYNKKTWAVKVLNSTQTSPSGLKLGLSKPDVVKILGCHIDTVRMIVSERGQEIQIPNKDLSKYMIFTFDLNGILTGLEFDSDIP